MHKCKSYGTDKLNIWPLWNLFDPCDLDLQHIWKNISNGNSPPRGQQLCKIILKSMHKMYQLWPGQAQFMTILTFIWPLWPWPSNYLTNVLNGTSSPQNNNCAKLFWNPCINVQVMARTSSIYYHFGLYLTPVTLTFNYLKKCFKRLFSSSRATAVPNCFEIHTLLYKLLSGQIRTDARMHGRMHIHRTKIVTTMSRLPASRLDKD